MTTASAIIEELLAALKLLRGVRMIDNLTAQGVVKIDDAISHAESFVPTRGKPTEEEVAAVRTRAIDECRAIIECYGFQRGAQAPTIDSVLRELSARIRALEKAKAAGV